MPRLSATLLVMLFLTSCDSSRKPTHPPLSRGIMVDNMDTGTSPRTDFYRYVNGKWVDRTPIPGHMGRWGAIDELRQYNRSVLRSIVEDAMNRNAYDPASDEGKALGFYRTAMDSLLAEQIGTTPLAPLMKIVEQVSDLSTLNKALIQLEERGVGTMFSNFIWVDSKKSSSYALFLGQGGTSLPSKDFYLVDNERFQTIRNALATYIETSFRLNNETSDGAAKKIIEMETELARISMSPLELRDQERTYNKMSLASADGLTQSLDLTTFFRETGYASLDTVIVSQVDFYKGLDDVIGRFSFDDWQAYLKWRVLSSLAPYLNNAFVQANFEFTKVLQGTTSMTARWDRVLQQSGSFMVVGEGIAKMYVAELFPPETKAMAQEMVDNILLSMRDHIGALTWMSDTTKVRALDKLAKVGTKIGYPEQWRGLEYLRLPSTSYADNVLAVRQHWATWFKDHLKTPVNRKYWTMMPHEVNAHYNPTSNEIVFPAGFLQPPFFDADMDAAVNYGAIGMVIGHEITHGFDNTGSQFDADGNLKNWWTAEDRSRFKALTDKLVDQYNQYVQIDTIKVNGQLTLGENIADLGGLAIAFDGLKRHWAAHGKPESKDGFTPEQRFFIAWNQGLRVKYRPEELRRIVMTSPHAPPHIRALGPVVNNPDFFEAFGVKPGDPMRRPDSLLIKIW